VCHINVYKNWLKIKLDWIILFKTSLYLFCAESAFTIDWGLSIDEEESV